MEITYQADCNEAETRQRVERIFENILGYDYIKHLSRERAVPGAGGTEYADYAIQLGDAPETEPVMLVELKRVGLNLAQKHLKQVSGYAIDCGCEWVLLTNGREWHLYHIEFGRPPVTKLVERWSLLKDDWETLASKFDLISLERVRRGGLDKLWKRTEVLQPSGLLKAILSPEALRDVRRVLKRDTGVVVTADDIVGSLRKMLNEGAAGVLQDVEVTLPPKVDKKIAKRTKKGGVRVSLKDLITTGLLPVGTTLFSEYKGTRYTAEAQADGTITFEGNSYKTPSAAGGAVTAKYNVSAPPGWDFWQLKDAQGNIESLDAVRKCYLSKQEEPSTNQ